MEIKKKTWPEYFEKIIKGEKNIDVRLADFELKEGDILVLEEFDPKTKKYTGRAVRKRVNYLHRWNPLIVYSCEEIKKFGFYEIEME